MLVDYRGMAARCWCARIFARFAEILFNKPKNTSLPPPSVERPIEPTVQLTLSPYRTPALFLQIATQFAHDRQHVFRLAANPTRRRG
jgi:hypothetical protein